MRLTPKTILCATDLSPYSQKAVIYGIALARKFGAKLIVAHAIDSLASGSDAAAFLPAAREDLQARVAEETRRLMGKETLEWETLIFEGDPAVRIAVAAEERGADLIITATHGRAGLHRFLVGSVTERLLHTATRPLLAVRSPEHEFIAPVAGCPLRVRKILVGCDFSPDSQLALEHAISLAEEFEAELHLLHALEPSVYHGLSKAAASLADDLGRAVKSAVEERLSRLVPREAHPWAQVKTVLASGAPHAQIARYAGEQGIDLIVLGVRGHGLGGTLFVGSTVDRVLRQAPCPMMTVRRLVEPK